MNDTTPQEAYSFHTSEWNKPRTEKLRDENEKLIEKFQEAQLADLESRKWTRWLVSLFVGILLFFQNGLIFYLIYKAFKFSKLEELQWFFGVLMTATLTATYKLVELIMKWLFTDKPYKPDC